MLFEELMSGPSERKLGKIVNKWWNIYENNKKTGLNHLTTLFLHSAGVKHETFDLTSSQGESLERKYFSDGEDLSNVPIALQQFSKTLKIFLDVLLQKNFWAIIQDSSFISGLISLIEYMRRSPHDSVRAVSYLSGMKIYRQSHYLSEHLVCTPISDKNTLAKKIEELKSKLYYSFRYSMRDKAAHLRMIPLTELLFWSVDSPYTVIEDNISEYVLRALKDPCVVNRKISLRIFLYIFEKPFFTDSVKQQLLFMRLIPELATSLRSSDEVDFLILKIVNQGAKFFNISFAPDEDLRFSMCLFSENGSVMNEAKTYFHENHFKGKSGVQIILKAFKFYRKCPVKNPPKFVEILMSYFIGRTNWRDWEFCLESCSADELNDYLNIFVLYVSFINKPSLHSLDSSAINKMKDEFTVYFSERWLRFMETDKISMNVNAQILMLKLATSFNVLKLFKKTQSKILDWSVNKFHQSRNHDFLRECLFFINLINSFNCNIEIVTKLKSQGIMEFIELLNSADEIPELFMLSHFKIDLLVQTYEDNYEILWGSLVSSIEKGIHLKKVEVVMSLLYLIVNKDIRKYNDFINHPEIRDGDLSSMEEKNFQNFMLKTLISSRIKNIVCASANFMEALSKNLIVDMENIEKKRCALRLYDGLAVLSNEAICFELFSGLPNIEPIAVYCSIIMNTDCQRIGPTASGSCCSLLNDYIRLTMEGKICMSYLKHFIMNFDKINSHWLLILKVFNFLSNTNNPLGAHVIINGLISFYNAKIEQYIDEGTIKEKISEVIVYILSNLENVEGRECQSAILHLYIHLEKLVMDGYTIYIEVMEKVKSFLSEEVRITMVPAYPFFQL